MNLSTELILTQLALGLNQGAFYALLSLGLSIIFGLLGVVNFAHGALYMLGAFVALIGYSGLDMLGIDSSLRVNFWMALIIAPLLVGAFGMVVERFMLRRLYHLDQMYGLLLTFGLALVLQGIFTNYFNVSGTPYPGQPSSLSGVADLGLFYYPKYRLFSTLFSLLFCVATWLVIERTKLGALLRASIEDPTLVRTFGVNVPRLVCLAFGFGAATAALAGVLAAPTYAVSPLMGSNLIITIFAIVVIGGLGSVMGSVITALMLGVVQGLTKAIYPVLSETIIFILMAGILIARPAGLFGKE